ncbi:MAG: glycerol-3-phosphate dehydrogenase [Myxococcota bacterium]|jgi:glycerol-3-phosphate dehydrogenase
MAGNLRETALSAMAESTYDLLVVGGGITGAGIARDATLRGLKVAVVDRGDWASGTSSKSSRLIHGGLRYLESYQFSMVLESVRERTRQAKLNPTLVWPQPFVVPVYQGDRHGLFKLNLGLWLYDFMCRFRAPSRHRRLSAKKTLSRVPGLASTGLHGSVCYYDYGTDDARLTLANVLDARHRGAAAANHVAFVAPVFGDDDTVAGAQLNDMLTGRDITVRCRHLVYATGAWTDEVAGAPGEGRLIRATKGVHIVVAKERLPVEDAVGMSAPEDGRVVFALPVGDTVYIGTTDTDYEGPLDDIRADASDVAYLLDTANQYFPDAGLSSGDILATWSGVRPLVRSDEDSAYKTSREHALLHDPRGITAIAGGKLTTYRAMAEEAVDAAVKEAKKRHPTLKAGRCMTHKTSIAPDPTPATDSTAQPGLCFADLMQPRANDEELLAQVAHAVRHEDARLLTDVMVRRLKVIYRFADQGMAVAPSVAKAMAQLLKHDDAWVEAQLTRYRGRVDAGQAGLEAGVTQPDSPQTHTQAIVTPAHPLGREEP